MYTGQWCLSLLQSSHFGTSHSSPIHHHLPLHIFPNLTDSLNLFPFFKGDFSFGKRQKFSGCQILGIGGQNHLGDLMFLQKPAWDMMHGRACCHDEATNYQLLPMAVAFWIIRMVSTEEVQAEHKMWCRFVPLLAQSFWMWWPHSTHAHQQCLPPPLTTTVKSSLFTHVHSSSLSFSAKLRRCGTNCSHYINNGWTFSKQTLCIYVYVCIYVHICTHTYIYTCVWLGLFLDFLFLGQYHSWCVCVLNFYLGFVLSLNIWKG